MKKSLANFVIFIKVLIVSLSIFFVTQSPAFAFQPDIHGQITVEVLNATQPVVDGQKLQFSQAAIAQIVDANKTTDDIAYQTQSALHFDGEDFYWGSKRLIDLRERVVKKITTTNFGPSARADLGGAMHTLQDFYAHSNWVELGNNSIKSDLGRQIFTGAGSTVATCPNDKGVLGGEGLKQLTSGYFPFVATKPLCDAPSGKCRHGVTLGNLCPDGLNKDDDSRKGFETARSLAVSATQDFLNQVLQDPQVANNAKAIKLLLNA